MKKELLATAMGSVLAVLATAPADALEFVRKERGLLGSGALSYLLPIPTSRGQERPEARMLSKKQVEAINEGKVDLPKCVAAEGSLRIVEPDDGQALWASYGLPMPTRMLRSFVTESSCWMVLDRGVGFAAAQAERELASGGHLQRGSNLGGGQMLAADYILIPDIVSQNANAGGRNFGAGGGGSAGGLGRLMLGGGGSSRQKNVSVMLTLVDSRTSEVLATSNGSAEVSDRQWQLMASGAGQAGMASGQGNISAGAYENTEMGTVIRAAYHQAFHQMLFDLEPMDLRARVQAAPQASQQRDVAQASAYGTGGSPTMTTSSAPAQMQLDQHAAHTQMHTQQIQQLRQGNQQPQQLEQQMYQQQMQQQQMLQQQYLQQNQQYQQQNPQYQQASPQGLVMNGNVVPAAGVGQALVQGAVQQVAGQMLPAGAAQLAGQVMQGAQQGNLGQALVQGAVQQVAGQMLPAGAAQLAGQVMQGAQQGNLGQALVQGAVQQVAGQMLPAGAAQLAGQVMQGAQQGNLGQALVQGAVQQLASTGAGTNTVMVLRVPANFMADPSGNGNVMRVLQPGETLARLGAQAGMLQVRDTSGIIGWVPADTIADLINAQ